MKDKGIVITYVVVVVLGIIFTMFGFGKKDVPEDVSKEVSEERYILDPLTNNALENVVLIHVIDYNYLGEVDTIEHDWLVHNEPEYMLDVIEACAVVIDSFFNSNVPTAYYYSNSDEYSYLTTDTDVCLLIPEDSSMNELIVEVGIDKVYLYEVHSTSDSKSYNALLDYIDGIISDMVIDEETQTITSGLYKYEFSSDIPKNYKSIIKQLHKEVGVSYQTYFIYDEKDGKVFVLLDSCEEYYMTVMSKDKSYISNDMKEKLESLDTSEEYVSDTNYRTLTDEELKYIGQVCSEYDVDIDKSTVEFDLTTDTYIVRSEQATVFIELSTGIVDIEYTKYINY